jgi:selenide,water dikinase
MRCGGCGSTRGSTVLSRVLTRLPASRPDDDVVVGLGAPDDAAVVRVPPGKVAVHTVDFFRGFLDDPYLFARVACNHALSDIFAMGARPHTALALASLPFGPERKMEEMLYDLMMGAVEVLQGAGAHLVGGHTNEGAELAFGLAANGIADPETLMRKEGMRPGEVLVLTKPVGTGTLFAADMRGKAKARWIDGAVEAMLQSNQAAADCLRRYGARACTDITGFGLLGHLLEMTRPSGVDAELHLNALPVLDGALDTLRLGIFSSLQPENLRLRRAVRNLEQAARDERYPLLFDPQTSGGLLASLSEDSAADCLADLAELGYEHSAIIGRVLPAGENVEPIIIA